MEVRLNPASLETIETEALVAVAFDKESPNGGLAWETTREVNRRLGGFLEELYRTGEFSGKAFEKVLLHRPSGLAAKRLLLVGAGRLEKFTTAELRRVTATAVRHLKSRSIREATLALDAGAAAAEQARAAVEGAILGEYDPDRYKTEKKNGKAVDRFAIAVAGGEAEIEQAIERGRIVADCQNFARDLISEPANRLSPTLLADRAREIAQETGLECEVLDRDRMAQLGMGALLGVAQGSAEPPALIVLRYNPEDKAASVHLGFVGKGVTFDTGGISIKPSENMDKMKYDMAGGAAVLAAMRALARLRPSVPVTGLVPAVENMPGPRAQRPGDIVTTLSGKTVEVLNTDAEGRLILADALTYAKRLGCTHLIDAATLTGAIVIALGHVNAGAFSNDQAFLDRVLAAARAEGEKFWPMPLDDEYKDLLKSAFADLPNIGNRWGGAITAAMFLKEFVESTPWVHLDIAGTAWLEESKPFMAKGPSGVTVRTLVNVAMSF